ncbi:MAG TPA: YhjD/YihY/BrkB family envelope integrity protein [Thermoanaerobaculia bacterium]|nr:YhjD/YihY/BrkB family envelope integrity protein [Thermoanaerobaculia bacterium]
MSKSTEIERREWTGWSLLEIVGDTYRGFRADRGYDLAASLAFTTLLTAVPMLAAFSIFLVTFFRENDDQIIAVVNALLPYQTVHLTESLRDFITESTAISGVGLVIALVASLRLVFVVEGVVNAVWGAPRRKMSVRRVVLYSFALLALGLVLGGIGLGLRSLRHSVSIDSAVKSMSVTAAPFVLKGLLLTLLFRYLPNTRVRWVAAATGGTAVALALELLRVAFNVYVEAMMRMNLITGSIGFVFLAILSLYLAWALILLGVELTHVLQAHVVRASGGLAGQGRAERAIRMLLKMSSGESRSVAEIQADPDAPPAETIAILEELQRAGLVAGDSTAGYRRALPSNEITVARVIDALAPDLYRLSPQRQDRVAMVLEPLFYRIDAERRGLLRATLADLKRRS